MSKAAIWRKATYVSLFIKELRQLRNMSKGSNLEKSHLCVTIY